MFEAAVPAWRDKGNHTLRATFARKRQSERFAPSSPVAGPSQGARAIDVIDSSDEDEDELDSDDTHVKDEGDDEDVDDELYEELPWKGIQSSPDVERRPPSTRRRSVIVSENEDEEEGRKRTRGSKTPSGRASSQVNGNAVASGSGSGSTNQPPASQAPAPAPATQPASQRRHSQPPQSGRATRALGQVRGPALPMQMATVTQTARHVTPSWSRRRVRPPRPRGPPAPRTARLATKRAPRARTRDTCTSRTRGSDTCCTRTMRRALLTRRRSASSRMILRTCSASFWGFIGGGRARDEAVLCGKGRDAIVGGGSELGLIGVYYGF